MLLTKEINLKCCSRNLKYLKEISENISIGDEITIPIEKLSLGSNKKIKVKCDNCGIVKCMTYYDYNKITKNNSEEYYCSKCKNIKIKKTNLQRYGVENVFQLEETKEKIKKTCVEKYGVEHHLQNKNILQKQKETNIKKYGVKYQPQLNQPLYKNNEFKKICHKIHNNKYNYDLVNYVNGDTEIDIICPIHGIFKQLSKSHLNGHGCNECNINKFKNSRLYTKEDFIEKANIIHNNEYDYSKVVYKRSDIKVTITCHKHGDFEQRPQDHLNNSNGCPICRESKGEKQIRIFLQENNINFEYQKRFYDCIDKNILPFDFYIQEKNTCVEFDGEQHFKVVEKWGGEEGLKNRKRRDKIKTNFCKENSINLIRIRYNENIKNKLECLK